VPWPEHGDDLAGHVSVLVLIILRLVWADNVMAVMVVRLAVRSGPVRTPAKVALRHCGAYSVGPLVAQATR
jgi:hypothetical protein